MLHLPKIYVSRNSVAGIVKRLWGSTVRDSKPGRYKRFFYSSKRPRWLCGPHSYLFNGYPGYFPGVKRPVRDVGHSPPSSSKSKNELSYTYTAPIRLHRVEKDNLTFLPSCLTHIPQNRRLSCIELICRYL
jgi:hypothetical protein